MRSRVLALVVAVSMLSACAGSDTRDPADRAQAMLANLPDCSRVSLDEAGQAPPEVAGLMLPEGAMVTSVLDQGALTTVEATIRMTPLQVRAHYEERDDIELLRVEDEIFEAEVLLRAEQRRMYLRASALCADGTALTAVVGPDSDEAGLPEFQHG
ncbi:MAG TPA: hypothetical protein VFX61_21785 [Micromonosporaceae bacterium]|nr:hypothetical protein [Micromonosporaceae bacterium]